MAKITGRVEVWVNGILLLNKAGAVISGIGVSGQPAYELAAVMGDTGFHGYTETPALARCEVTVTDRDDIMLSDLAGIFGNGTIVFKAAGGSGKVYTMEGATCLRNFSLTAGEGEVPIVFEGPYWTEGVQ
jgi:hypothetical protein